MIISIHALLAESDVMDTLILTNAMLFLSTLSLRRATTQSQIDARVIPISIHALLAESDHPDAGRFQGAGDFYPRSPCGERRDFKRLGLLGWLNFYPRSPCGERLLQS